VKRRQKSAWVRASDEGQWWQDLQSGHAASGVSGANDDDDYYAAMIYLPDPTSRSGYQLHGVDKPSKDEPEKPVGFRR
jgi:hypothetical protein